MFPGMTVFQVGGHCPGEMIALVETATGPLILASDAAHFYEQLEHGGPFSPTPTSTRCARRLAFIAQAGQGDGRHGDPRPRRHGRGTGSPPAEGPAGTIATVLV